MSPCMWYCKLILLLLFSHDLEIIFLKLQSLMEISCNARAYSDNENLFWQISLKMHPPDSSAETAFSAHTF